MKIRTTRSFVLTAIVAGLFGLAGCDGSDSSTAETPPAATSEAPATTAPAAPAESSSTAPAGDTAATSETPAPSTDSSATTEAPAPAADSSAATDAGSLPQTCEDYFKKAEDLAAKAGGGSGDQLKQMMDQQRSQMESIKDQAQLESSCKQALDMLNQQQQNMPQ